jgi:hypothetical protein
VDIRGKKSGVTQESAAADEAACLKFNLTPMEAEYLARSFKEIAK